jgi:hypothetical protein
VKSLPSYASRLPLALFVFCVFADHPHHAAARNHLALDANLLYRCPNFHLLAALLRAEKIERGMLFLKPLGFQLSAFSFQLSAFSFQLSAFSSQLSRAKLKRAASHEKLTTDH